MPTGLLGAGLVPDWAIWTGILASFGAALAWILRPRSSKFSPDIGPGRAGPAIGSEADEEGSDDDADVAIDGELDLHHFQPKEVARVVEAYVHECSERGITELRIVHGKGRGTLRRTVHGVLGKLPQVEHFELAQPHRGGWGATMVDLKRS